MLSTIGYEGAPLEDFVRTLVATNVEILVDIRERAQSRRKGFSKSALAARLAKAGIGYVHYRELGDPKAGREAARAGKMSEFRRVYRNVLRRVAAIAAIDEIRALLKRKNACLMCYERDYKDCHRKMVSDKIEKQTGRTTRHLKVFSFEQATERSGRVRNSREGVAASQQQLL